jgi:hypothetical protein
MERAAKSTSTARLSLIAALYATSCASVLHAPASVEQPRFDRDIRPLLADRCFSCHGPDEAKRKGGLRLDTEEGARAALAGGRQSELARRIQSPDPDEVMPPPKLKRPLSDSERELLLLWLDHGAELAPHWAFLTPQRPARAQVQAADWARDELDTHVLASLERRGLAPKPEADPRTLLRRASLVITGLPPSPEEATAFARAPSDAEYERRVDALLSSPRAAEHMATVWLDLARFADTHGYQTDGAAFTWPWRDWLLRSLQDNMPYDEFVTAILAGDLKPEAALDDFVATGFHRLHRMTEEGGSISEEFRQEAIADRVSTFGTTFLGLTVECARCHDHKYDPISTNEFYSLAAMFGRIDENGLKPYALPVNAPPPFVRLSTSEQAARERELRSTLHEAERAFVRERTRILEQTLAGSRGTLSAPLAPPPLAHYPLDVLTDGQTPNRIEAGKSASTDRHRPEQLGQVVLTEGRSGMAARFDGDGGLWLDGISSVGRHDEVSLAMWVRPSERNARAALVHASGFYTQDADASGIELELVEGQLRWSAIHLWPGSAASVHAQDPLPLDTWTHVVATYDGSSRAEGLRLYIDGKQATVDIVRDELDGPLAGHTLEVGSRSRGSGFRGGSLDELRVWRRSLSAAEVHAIARADGLELPPCGLAALAEHVVDVLDPEIATRRDAVRRVQRDLAAHLDPIATFACMRDSPRAPATHVLRRGAYDQPDTTRPIEPGAVEAVLPFDPSLPRDRMGLARWMLDPRHPLMARVAVNRLWEQVFGRGLVASSENFGMQGSFPSNRDVLDLLAYDFVHGDGTRLRAWDTRGMLRRIVLSATFRQSSTCSAGEHAADPDNEWLARGPATRMSAEMLRDSALLAAGILVERVGGPSVRPWQPEGLWGDAGQGGGYSPDVGEGAHRRSLYTFRKRTVPVPDMSTFDAGSREVCQPRRGATNTPLQALVLWNDPVFVECARQLALRAASEADGRTARLQRAFELVATRLPDAEEMQALQTLVEIESTRFAGDLESARSVCGEADAELAAHVLACSTLLASDAAMVTR